jgi:hypothetical protein
LPGAHAHDGHGEAAAAEGALLHVRHLLMSLSPGSHGRCAKMVG